MDFCAMLNTNIEQSQEEATNYCQQDCQNCTLPIISSDFMNNMLSARNMNNIPIRRPAPHTPRGTWHTVNVTFISPLIEVPSSFKLLHNPVKPYIQD